MPNQATLADVIALAEFAHRGQYDKAGNPYIEHPMRVLKSAQNRGAPPYAQFAAVLHDVTEDTPFTLEMLRAFSIPEATLEIVRLMDRHLSAKDYDANQRFLLDDWVRKNTEWPSLAKVLVPTGDSDDEFVANARRLHAKYNVAARKAYYYSELKKNEQAVWVKRDDIGDNRQPWRLVYLPEKDQARLVKKYDDALEALA